eukprot:501427-Rhodomonas_salina.1
MTGQWSMRRAIKESKPSAVRVCDIIKPDQIPRAHRSNLAVLAMTCVNAVVGRTTQRIQINPQHCSPLGAFIALTQMINMSVRYSFAATALPPEPTGKNQTEARKRADAQDWIDAEW